MKTKTINTLGNVQLAYYLKNLRLDKNLSKSELGVKVGANHTIVTQIEQGERRLDLIDLVRYCKALDANPVDALQIIINAESSA